MNIMNEKIKNIYLAFNDLDSLEDQHEVVDTLYEALFKSNLRQVLANRIVISAKKDLEQATIEIGMLKSEIDELKDTVEKYKEKIKFAIRPNQYYESLSEEEKAVFKAEVYEDVFIKQLRNENIRLRSELKELSQSRTS